MRVAELHISVAAIKASRSVPTKFRILYGRKKVLQFKAETTQDRQRWINILSEAKAYYKRKLDTDPRSLPPMPADDQALGDPADVEGLREQLDGTNASSATLEVCLA